MLAYYLFFAYLGFLSISEIFGIREIKLNQIYLSNLLILTIFIGLRRNIGVDSYLYEEFFHKISSYSLQFPGSASYSSFGLQEYGYYLLNFVTTIVGDFQIIILLTTLFKLFALSIFFKEYKVEWRYTFILILFSVTFFRGLDVLRQSIAADIFLISLCYLNDSKKYFTLNLLGTFFHFTAFILAIIYPIVKSTFSRLFVFGVLILFCISKIQPIPTTTYLVDLLSAISDTPLISTLFAYHEFNYIKQEFSPTVDLPTLTFLSFIIINYHSYTSLDSKHRSLVNVFILLAILSGIFSDLTELVSRMSYYFYFGYTYVFILFLQKYRKFNMFLTSAIPISYAIIKLSLIMAVDASRISYTPYSNFLVDQSLYGYELYMKRSSATDDFYSGVYKTMGL